MSALITGRVSRAKGVLVGVWLGQERPTMFVDDARELPSDDNILRLDLHPNTNNVLDLATALDCLWPAGSMQVRARIGRSRRADNRLDMETELQMWADTLAAILAWWHAQESGFRSGRLHALGRTDSEMVALLSISPPPSAQRLGPLTGQPPAKFFEDHFLGRDRMPSQPDEQSWNAWKDRTLEDLLGPRGGLRQLMGEDFEPRAGQMDMALAVEKSLNGEHHLMVEAGTGIGKSLAYLLPALLYGAARAQRVVISTHTKALQAQLMEHDLPLVRRLGYPGRARLLLGRNNYLCRRQLRRSLLARAESREDARAQFALAVWSRQSEEGRQSELTEHTFFPVHWRALFASVEPCSPHICHPEPACFVVRARRVARDCEVVVVNHSLLMMDLKSGQTLMGPSRLAVIDEAHHLSEIATRALSQQIARTRLDVYHNLLGERVHPKDLREIPAAILRVAQRKDLPSLAKCAGRCDRALEDFLFAFQTWFNAVEASARGRLAASGSAHRPGEYRYHDGDEAFGGFREQQRELLEAASEFENQLTALVRQLDDDLMEPDELSDEREGLNSLIEFHRDHHASIRFCVAADDEDWVYWFQWRGDAGLEAIVAAPLTVEHSLSEMWDRHYHSAVFTSATLAVADDFTPFAESVGMTTTSRFTETLLVPSPFEHEEQALILTSLGVGEPRDPRFAAMVASVVAPIATRVATKILVLSTSYRLIEQIAEELGPLLPDAEDDLFDRAGDAPAVRPVLLLQQPGTNRDALAARFRAAEAAVLLATGSFWEGIDFPGRELEVLVVPRLPFAVPTDPLIEGRSDRAKRLGRDPFAEVSLADAVLRLKQGVGRLLRSADDRGVVLLLDQRLHTKSYGVSFLKSLPRACELVPSVEEIPQRVIDFLREGERSARGRA